MARAQRRKNAERRRLGFTRRLRTNLLAGILITAPIGITFYLSWLVIGWIDSKVTPIIPEKYNPETYLRFSIPGLGLVVPPQALGSGRSYRRDSSAPTQLSARCWQ